MLDLQLLSGAIDILRCEETSSFVESTEEIKLVLEDEYSPINRKYQQKLYQSVIDKNHIDFDSISKSAGNIKTYEGYSNMIDTLSNIKGLASAQNSKDVIKLVSIVETADKNIEMLSSTYSRGFMANSEFVMLEYNTYVYTCIEATSALLYEFVEYMKDPVSQMITIKLKNTKTRANLFYFEQLSKFNKVNEGSMGTSYRKYLENIVNKGANNFFGLDDSLVIGGAVLTIVALSIIPVTRELVYQFYRLRGNLSKSLELQGSFLEMNKACIEANQALTADKKKKIIDKQEKIRQRLLKLSDTLKVSTVKARVDSKKEIESANKMLSIDNLRADVSNSPLEIF